MVTVKELNQNTGDTPMSITKEDITMENIIEAAISLPGVKDTVTTPGTGGETT